MKKRTHSGFTLIELLVGVGLIALVGIFVSQIFFTTVRTSVKSELLKETKQSGDLALDVISRMIRNAASVTTACSESGTALSAISIKNPDSFITTFGCTPDASNARISSTSGTKTEFLTTGNVSLGADCASSTLTFVCTALATQRTSVKITFSLTQVGTPVDQFEKASTSFQTTVTTRN